MGNPVVHFEIMTGGDAGELQSFYADAFGWQINADNPMSYGMVDTDAGGRGIVGGIGASQDGTNSLTFYVEVPELEPAIERIQELGGKLTFGPVDVPGFVTFAQVLDPAGNMLGLVKATPSS